MIFVENVSFRISAQTDEVISFTYLHANNAIIYTVTIHTHLTTIFFSFSQTALIHATNGLRIHVVNQDFQNTR